jgi:hypothetical protein
LLLLALVAVLTIFPRDLVVAGHSLARLNLHYRPEALVGVAKSIWVHDNWHLFGYLLPSILAVWLITARASAGRYLGIVTALGCAVGLFLVLFLFTGYAAGAVRYTAVGRISIQLVPGLVFLAALLCHEVMTQGRGNPDTSAPSSPSV